MLPRFLMALCATLLFAACAENQGQGEQRSERELIKTIREYVALKRAPKQERPPLTRAMLDTVPNSYIEVTIEDTGVFAYLTQQLVRRDGLPGQIVVWQTEDLVTLSMRDGVLIATRGLRGDIISASALIAGDGRQGPAGQGRRTYDIRMGDGASRKLEFQCLVQDLGAKVIEIVERQNTTRHLIERCEGNLGTIENEYWVDSTTGVVMQSRQWSGPTTGYLRIRRLTN
ncbi:YjbF family lipoprotein [Cognatishimia sp. WU-CL00825]|uniref:YjbF family lipoprotein n=1 Tax=Cognatishimia sp. WU-CL00825 TaxID=3127658 RepID=UPI0031026F9E